MSLPKCRIETDGTTAHTQVWLVLDDGTELELATTRLEKLADVNAVLVTLLASSNLPKTDEFVLDVSAERSSALTT